jgi:hypothetical protein
LYEHLPDELENIWQAEKLSLANHSKIASKRSRLWEKKEKKPCIKAKA